MSPVATVTQATFDAQVLGQSKPVLVDFYADWCGPCQAMAPTLDAIANAQGDQLSVVKVDIEANKDLAMTYGVRSIPNLMLFRDGEVVANQVGVSSESQLTQWLDANR